MAKRKATKETKGAADFATFMAAQSKTGTVIDLGSTEEVFYKTQDYNLDRALGGGIEAGSIVALQGPSSSGKSLAALTIAKQMVDDGGRVAYFDTENKISKKAIRRLGMDGNDNFMHLTVSNLQDMIATVLEYAESGFFRGIVIDSVDALVADALEERDLHEESKVGGYDAKIWSERLPQIVAAIQRSGDAGDSDLPTTLMMVRQVRDNPGVMYGSTETTSGGRALEFYSTTVLRFGPNKSGDELETVNSDSGNDTKLAYQGATIRILKTNQGAKPKDPVEVRFYIGDNPAKEWGIDRINSLVDEAVRLRILPKRSATSHWFDGCDELCERMGVASGDLSYNGKNQLLTAVTNDRHFQEVIAEMVDERQAMDPVEYGIAENDEEEVEMDFEELDEE